MRLTNEQLSEICNKKNIKHLWSFSRFDCYRQSKYEFFLSYIKNVTPQAPQSPYSSIGGAAHDILERLYNGEIDYQDMADDFDASWITEIELLDLKFDRNDSERNRSIREKYYENIIHFFRNYHKLPYKVISERFVTIDVTPGIVFQGYIDAMYKDENDVINIIDYKTSTAYSGKAIEQHSHQLVLYAEALHQLGVPIDKIKIAWNFLKYVRLYQLQANGKWKDTVIERRDIGKKIQSKAKMWLKKALFDERQIDEFLNESLVSNTIDNLPDEVRDKFRIEDAYVYIDNWHDIWVDLKKEIIETVGEIESKVEEYNVTGDDKTFWDDDENIKANMFYYTNLSDYTINQLVPVKNYLERIEAEKEMAGDLLGVNKKAETEEDEDFSWLEGII